MTITRAEPIPTSDDATPPTWLGLDVRRHRWLFPAAGVLTTFVRGAATFTFSLLILPLEREFGWTRAETVTAFSVYAFVVALGLFFGGVFVDRFGPRIPIVLGTLLVAVAHVLLSRMSSTLELILGFGVTLALGVALSSAAATFVLAARWYPMPTERGLAIGVSVMGIGFGGLVAVPLWQYGFEHLGWRGTVLLTGGVYVLILMFVGSVARFPNQEVDQPPKAGDFNLQEAILTRRFWTIVLMLFLTLIGGMMIISQVFPMFSEAVESPGALTATIAATGIIVQAICNSLARPLGGWISGVLGLRTAQVLCGTSMATGLLILANASPESFGAASFGLVPLIGIGLVGLGLGGSVSLAAVCTAASFGTSYFARTYGLVMLLGSGSAGFLGPWIGALLRQRTGDYDVALYLGAGLALLCLVLGLLMLPAKGEERLEGEW
ncbi:MAG: MFS transporter [Phycisphaerales bacterium]|nr:MFS transporter [Phycisphaerales bacterium]